MMFPARIEDTELDAAHRVAMAAFDNAANCDHDGAFPEHEVAALHSGGLLRAPLPIALGGVEPSAGKLAALLRRIGSGSLPLGRLYEGHVNALALIMRYGAPAQKESAAEEARQGALFGVWNTDDARGLHLISDKGRWRLEGRKILASGAGRILRPLVTATDEAGRRLMVVPQLDRGKGVDLSRWTAHGMRASATGAVDFTGILVSPDEIIGTAGDYERQPFFSGGAWRFCAVHLGGMERLFALLRQHLNQTERGSDPHQAARVGEAGIAVETARLWVRNAAEIAHNRPSESDAEKIVAYVNLARLAVESAGLTLMQLVQRSVGLQSFMRPHPIERISRDLSTYLRQPGPDRALTTAAAWMLAQEEGMRDLWK